MTDILQEVHDSWKAKGFPYYPTDENWRKDKYNQLVSFKRDTLIDRQNKIIGQSAHGLNLAWSFMEHAWGIKCGKMRTPIEIWEDEEHGRPVNTPDLLFLDHVEINGEPRLREWFGPRARKHPLP